jgi:hypothetical protein
MKNKLETKIIDSYLNKEITCLEKEMAMLVLSDVGIDENIGLEEAFSHLIDGARISYSNLAQEYTKEQLDDMAVFVANTRDGK